MKSVRQQRKAIWPLRTLIGRPRVFTWTGNAAFKRSRGKRFKLLSNILRDDEFMSFCAAIGWVEANWAMMEQQMDWWVKLVFVRLGGIPGIERAPSGFYKKSLYLREAFMTIPDLGEFRADCISVLDRADRLSQKRNDITHAVITHMKPRGSRYEMENLRVSWDGTHTLTPVVFDVREFPDLSGKLAHLAADAIDLSRRLLGRFGTSELSL